MKKFIKKLFRFLHLKIEKIHPDIHELTFDEIYSKFIKNPIIFDVGANEGQSIERFKKIFINYQIHCFEPNYELYQKLKKKYEKNKNIIVNNSAVSNEIGKGILNITQRSGSSSMLNIKEDSKWIKIRSKQLNTEPKKFVKKKEEVSTVSLNDYCKTHNIKEIDILKIDTQGFEDKVLLGSSEMIKNQSIKFLELEIIQKEAYEKYFSFYDLEKLLIPNDYRLCSIHLSNNNIFEGNVFFADNLYISKKFLSRI
tara:strand:- start:90 stop:851 length:762 start_codon:yes stop_codon:yes gene_type:complete